MGPVCGALRWRRLDGRYLPGAGSAPPGYVLTRDGPDPSRGRPGHAGFDVEALWGDA